MTFLFFSKQEKEIISLSSQLEELKRKFNSPVSDEEASPELLKLRTENSKLKYQRNHLIQVCFECQLEFFIE